MSNCKPDLLENLNRCAAGDGSFDLSQSSDLLQQDRYAEEALNIGGATIHVYKLLGVHEQGTLQDITQNGGKAISSGSIKGWDPDNIYKLSCKGWASSHKGNTIPNNAWVGFDFGELKNKFGENRFSVETFNHKHIATIAIRQGDQAVNRARKVRVERSLNGRDWTGVQVLELPDDDKLHMLHFKGSAASRYWRIRVVEWNGNSNSHWVVDRLQMMEYEKTSLFNIQKEFGFSEVRDREYQLEPVAIKASFDILDIQTDVNPWAFSGMSQNSYYTVNFTQTVRLLGRPIVIGDIFEIPSEAQYRPDLSKQNKYMEVVDIGWSTEGYTPGWQPIMQRIIANPIVSSQETMDVVANYKMQKMTDGSIFKDIQDGFADLTDLTDNNTAVSHLNAPARGIDISEQYQMTKEQVGAFAKTGIDIQKFLSNNPNAYLVEDGLPPNGQSYTEAYRFPENPVDGQFVRILSPVGSNIAPRLHQYSEARGKWIYLETDRVADFSTANPLLHSYLDANNKQQAADQPNDCDDCGPSTFTFELD